MSVAILCPIMRWVCKLDKGAFNNYVDQILSNIDPLEWTIVDILHNTYPICHVELSADPFPPLLVHIIIECPPMAIKLFSYLVKVNGQF